MKSSLINRNKLSIFKTLTVLCSVISLPKTGFAYAPHKDWKVNKVCQKDKRLKKDYCFEVVELSSNKKKNENGAAILFPGLFHNAHIFDIDPKAGISLARYIQKNYKLNIYMVNYRYAGNSKYVPGSNLDDMAIDDIPAAIEFVFEKEKEKVFVIGHSQGAITSNASLSGLDYCGKKVCFNKKTALERQSMVKAFGILAGDNRLHLHQKDNPLLIANAAAPAVKFFLSFTDKISIEAFSLFLQNLDHFNFWYFLFNLENVDKKNVRKLIDKTFQASTKGILLQFSAGVTNKDLRTANGLSYADNSKNLQLPVYQQVFGKDPFAEAKPTMNDSFAQIGSTNKKIELFPNQGHEDFLVNKDLHNNLKSMMEFLLEQKD